MNEEELKNERTRLRNKLAFLQEDILSVKLQLEKGKALSVSRADLHWQDRVTARRRALGNEHKIIQEKLKEINSQLKDLSGAEIGSQFIDCAKRVLPPETYEAIWALVRVEN